MIDLKSSVYWEQPSGTFLDINTLTDNSSFTPTSPITGFRIKSITFGAANPIGYEDPRATRDGVDVADAYIGRRVIQVAIDVYGTTRQDLAGRIENIVKSMRFVPKRFQSTDGFRRLKFTVLTNDVTNFPTGTIECYAVCRPAQMPQVETNPAMFSGSDQSGYSTGIVLAFIMKSPYKYSETLKTSSVGITGTAVSLHNHGSAPSYAELLIEKTYGVTPALNAALVKFTVTLNGTPLTLSIPASTIGDDATYKYRILINYDDQLVYDSRFKKSDSVVTNTLNQKYIIINSGALFGIIDPDDDHYGGSPSTVSITCADSSNNPVTTGYTATITWREAWY
jgi:hypothetical protein